MKKKQKRKIFGVILIFSTALVIFIVAILIPKKPLELSRGSLATGFCENKCDGIDNVATPYNNTDYNFISMIV